MLVTKRLIFSLFSLKDRILASSLFSPNTPNTIIFALLFLLPLGEKKKTNLISSALCFCSTNSAKKIFSNRRPKRRGKFGPEEACQTIHEFGHGDAVKNSLKQFTSLHSSPLSIAYPVQSPNFLCWTFKEASKFLKFFFLFFMQVKLVVSEAALYIFTFGLFEYFSCAWNILLS